MLNIPAQDYALRTEVTHLFTKHSITADMLVFRDQLNLHKLHQQRKLTLTLVDHNVLTGSDVIMEHAVQEVIDHHQNERADAEGYCLCKSGKYIVAVHPKH